MLDCIALHTLLNIAVVRVLTILSFIRDYLPELIPVEVPEPKAKEWFRTLLSGVQFLHEHGVVHNDIKYVSSLCARLSPRMFCLG